MVLGREVWWDAQVGGCLFRCCGECAECKVADQMEISAEIQGSREELVGDLVDGERVWRCYQCAGGFFHVLASIAFTPQFIHVDFAMAVTRWNSAKSGVL